MVTRWERTDLLALVCDVYPGAGLYRFLIFALFLTFTLCHTDQTIVTMVGTIGRLEVGHCLLFSLDVSSNIIIYSYVHVQFYS